MITAWCGARGRRPWSRSVQLTPPSVDSKRCEFASPAMVKRRWLASAGCDSMRVMTRPGRSPLPGFPTSCHRHRGCGRYHRFRANVHQVELAGATSIALTDCHPRSEIQAATSLRHSACAMRHDPVKTVEVLLGSRVRYTIQTPPAFRLRSATE